MNQKKEATEDKLEALVGMIKARLKDCLEMNGVDYCKNCGLNFSDIPD